MDDTKPTTARPLWHHAGAQPGLGALQPADHRARPQRRLHRRPRSRRARHRRQRLARRHLLRAVLEHHARRRRHAETVPPVLVPRRHPVPRRARDARLDQRGRRTRLLARARLRRRARQPRPDPRDRHRRRRGRDGDARDELAPQQVPEREDGWRGAAHPESQRLQDREPDDPRAHPRRRTDAADARLRLHADLGRGRLRRRRPHGRARAVRGCARAGARRDRGHPEGSRAKTATRSARPGR